jgi:hypothetical protein
MSKEYTLLVADFIFCLICFVMGVSYGTYVLCNLKIRLNTATKVRWVFVFLGLTLRVTMTIIYVIEGTIWISEYLWIAYWLLY